MFNVAGCHKLQLLLTTLAGQSVFFVFLCDFLLTVQRCGCWLTECVVVPLARRRNATSEKEFDTQFPSGKPTGFCVEKLQSRSSVIGCISCNVKRKVFSIEQKAGRARHRIAAKHKCSSHSA
jgi:hypothetical protein